jgi:hypothetical protein
MASRELAVAKLEPHLEAGTRRSAAAAAAPAAGVNPQTSRDMLNSRNIIVVAQFGLERDVMH